MHKIIIPGELPDLNTIIAKAQLKANKYQAYSQLKQINTDKVAWIAKRLPKLKRIDLDITWYCKNKRKDKDNIAAVLKFILDGLVKAGTLNNDGWKQINNFSHKFKVDKENPRVEVIITEVTNV